ncbi:hypothetical protein PG991_000904 [Apiospora marii]|uniref:Heterokaryon incompatibility domain-containing protein n=1 Tax=Apiospora marii TaxID=335849 RepID=A0ABR1STB5_9PEZI
MSQQCSINELPNNLQTFHDYPKKNGWALDHKYQLHLGEETSSGKTLEEFFQSWLFYGLIFTIVQKDKRPVLQYGELNTGDKGAVTTKKLANALAIWEKWECGNSDGRDLRMVRVQEVLDIARRTIKRRFSCEGDSQPQQPQLGGRLNVDDKLVLGLMTLGETLSAAKARIMQKTNPRLSRWHYDQYEGWGEPRFVIKLMEHHEWCPRTMHIWRCQLDSNATLLLAAYFASKDNKLIKGPEHKLGTREASGTKEIPPCTKDSCHAVSANDASGTYHSRHAPDCYNHACGKPVGPRMETIIQNLKDNDISLLRFVTHEENNVQLQVIPWSPDSPDTPTMDTLVIPVHGQGNTDMRNRAIKQIFPIFKHSCFTLVLDAGLAQLSSSKDLHPSSHAAMRALASGWMSRLWTLQEAFLSKEIYYVFQEGSHSSDRHHLEVGTLLESLKAEAEQLRNAIFAKVYHHLKHNILDHERNTRNPWLFDPGHNMPPLRTAKLVANTLKATSWRSTTHYFHETLSLATLLGLLYKGTAIDQNGLLLVEPSQPEREADENGDHATARDQMMKTFWKLFNGQLKGSIPPGIIFLPGEKVNHQGFGWAPRTWMSANPTDHPDPLSDTKHPAELDCSGLKVRYPGFLLDIENRNNFLFKPKSKFWFPTEPSLETWYGVEVEDNGRSEDGLIEDSSSSQLAIILSRPRPGVAPEIGLLVQIRKTKLEGKLHGSQASGKYPTKATTQEQGNWDSEEDERVFYCNILNRVKVHRELMHAFREVNRGRMMLGDGRHALTPPLSSQALGGPSSRTEDLQIPEIMVNTHLDDKICLADELDSNQAWYVDGLFPKDDNSAVPVSLAGPSMASEAETEGIQHPAQQPDNKREHQEPVTHESAPSSPTENGGIHREDARKGFAGVPN